MQDIRVLVADDEIPARGELKYELATIPGVQIVGECKNGKEVLDFLNVHPNVDILFLDIEMPFMNGLECAKEIQRRDYPVKIVSPQATASSPSRPSISKPSTTS